jgi:hypothetical protein
VCLQQERDALAREALAAPGDLELQEEVVRAMGAVNSAYKTYAMTSAVSRRTGRRPSCARRAGRRGPRLGALAWSRRGGQRARAGAPAWHWPAMLSALALVPGGCGAPAAAAPSPTRRPPPQP